MEIKKTLERIAVWTAMSGAICGALYLNYKVNQLNNAAIKADERYAATPASLYAGDLNEDGKSDYVVVSDDGASRTIFLQQENDNYKRLDKVMAENQAEALSSIEAKIESIEEKASRLELKAKGFR